MESAGDVTANFNVNEPAADTFNALNEADPVLVDTLVVPLNVAPVGDDEASVALTVMPENEVDVTKLPPTS
jgi:hypothetical protein